MKMLYLGLFLVLAAGLGVNAQAAETASTTNTPASKASHPMNYTLKLWKNEKLIPHPTEADIRAAVTGLDNSEDGPRLILSTTGNTNELQVSGTPKDGFSFDYHEGLGDNYPIYVSAKTDYKADTVIKLFDAYLKGGDDWKKLIEWKKQ